MSLKNDIDMIRDELTSEEKFFEKTVITERFIKKYKNLLIGGVIAIVVGVGANVTYQINEDSRIDSANTVFSSLNDSPNKKILAELKELSPSLYDAYLYSKAVAQKDISSLESLQNSNALLVSNLAKYESATTTEALDTYSLSQEAIYKDLALVRAAVTLMHEGNTDKAHEKLLLISDNSSLNAIAKSLLHYGVK